MQKLYHGNNTYLSLRAVHDYLQNKQDQTDLVTLDGEIHSASNIIDVLYSPSLFATPKIYLLKRIYRSKEKDILMENLFKIFDQASTEILIWEDQKLRSNTRYYKFFKEHDALEEYNEFNKRTFVSWAKSEVEKYPFKLNSSLIYTLSERSNYNPERFVNNLNKLQLLNEPEISQDILDQTVSDTLETDIWKLINYINESNTKEITRSLEKLLEYKTDPNYILAMIARNLRIAVQTKYLLGNNADAKYIASQLKLPPFAIFPVIDNVKNINKEKLLLQYKKLSNLDYEIKTGRIEPILGLSLFTLIL